MTQEETEATAILEDLLGDLLLERLHFLCVRIAQMKQIETPPPGTKEAFEVAARKYFAQQAEDYISQVSKVLK